MSGSDRTVGQGVELYTARSGPELVVEAEVHAAAERMVRSREQDPEWQQTLLQMLGLEESPPSKRPSWERSRQRKSRAKPKQVSDAVE
jgi:hypothetical protein